MIIYTTTVFTLPVVLLISAIDTYLFLAAVRVVCDRCMNRQSDPSWRRGLTTLVDPLPERVQVWVGRWWSPPTSAWVPWAFTIIGLLVVRAVLVGLIAIAR